MNSSLLQTAILTTLAITCIGFELIGQNPVNFESGPVHALDLSDDGTRLFIANTIGGRLSVFDTSNPEQPLLRREIPVGLDPVSVHARTRDEVWVCNQLSDSVSIVSVSEGRVVATLRVIDEPSDIVFAAGNAFVTAATSDRVQVFDAVTRTPIATIDLFGKDPRALAVSPDETKVYAVIQRSGNGTTILPDNIAPPPPPPTNAALPTAPDQGLIVRWDDPQWSGQIPYSLPDHDVAEIDVATLTVARYFDAVGTTNTGIAVDANTGDLWVANTDARNLVRFEPQLRGHAIDSRVTKITTGATATVTAFDLNPGINYAQLPNNSARATALSEPFGIAFDTSQGVVFVAAQGTDRIAVIDAQGAVIDRIEIGDAIGAQIDTRNKRGPRALALHATA
ncbi:MAG: DNA-binding beta-propeller fold protein YncE, partial [Planctomycetota bacterium]